MGTVKINSRTKGSQKKKVISRSSSLSPISPLSNRNSHRHAVPDAVDSELLRGGLSIREGCGGTGGSPPLGRSGIGSCLPGPAGILVSPLFDVLFSSATQQPTAHPQPMRISKYMTGSPTGQGDKRQTISRQDSIYEKRRASKRHARHTGPG